MDGARERLVSARDQLATEHPSTAVSTAYYAMLYAARAALSEKDRYAKTHKGVWSLFSELFVRTGRFEKTLYDTVEDARKLREQSDYEAATMTQEEAEDVTSAAERFVAAVAEMSAQDA